MKNNDVWAAMASMDEPLYLYGTGDGADKILDEMDRRGIRPAGIFVSEDFYRGQTFRSFRVTTLSALEKECPSFTVVVSFGSHLPELIDRVKRIAASHTLLIPDVPVAGGELFDSSFYEAHLEELQTVRDLWADEASRTLFDQVIEYKLTGRPEPLFSSVTDRRQDLRDLLALRGQALSSDASEHESYVDLGAYRGDTIQEFLDLMGEMHGSSSAPSFSITALEPDPVSFRKLREAFGDRQDTRLFHAAVGASSGKLPLVKGRGRGSHLFGSGEAADLSQDLSSEQTVDVLALDDLTWPHPPTWIKMDVEGAEKEAILGAESLIRTFRPMLDVALYHRSRDLFDLPLLIHRLVPSYRLFLRRQECFPCWDLDLYALI